MAFNWVTFRTRTLTSIVFVAVMLTGLLWNQWSFFILFSIVHFGCWIEYQQLVKRIDPGYAEITPFHQYGVMLAGWCLLFYFSGDSYTLPGMRLHELGWWLGLICLFILPITELLFTRELRPKNIAHSFFGLIYISLSLGLMMDLGSIIRDLYLKYGEPGGPSFAAFDPFPVIYPLIIILSLWMNDTFAYLVGSLIGRTPLSPISPKKTWEGTIGGMLCCVALVGFVFSRIPLDTVTVGFRYQVPQSAWFIIPGIAAIMGTLGDLLESKLKRLANVKDSGHILPGHGGFLDRFDSLLVAVPFVWLYVKIFIR